MLYLIVLYLILRVDAMHKLSELYALIGEDQLAEWLNITKNSIESVLKGGSHPEKERLSTRCDQILHSISNPPIAKSAAFTFIDLFAGIGGIRRGFESIGGQCVFTSEWNKYAQKTYSANYRDHHPVIGDITQVDANLIPDHDVLLAGFPCQPFSLAGVSKKNSLGRAHGFDCNTQGTLFFDVERIISAKSPKAFLLENVKNLFSHDKGRTFKVITHTLEKKLGYKIFYKVIDANGFVPQHRQRVFIVGFRDHVPFNWEDFDHPGKGTVTLKDILHPEDGSERPEPPFTEGRKAKVRKDFILSTKLWSYLKDYKRKHEEKGNGFGFSVVTGDDTSRTLSARYHKDGSEILICRGKDENPRRLTPRECARLMGYPDSLKIPVSNTQAYRQFGNSVVVPVIEEIARIMRPHIMQLIENQCQIVPEQQDVAAGLLVKA